MTRILSIAALMIMTSISAQAGGGRNARVVVRAMVENPGLIRGYTIHLSGVSGQQMVLALNILEIHSSGMGATSPFVLDMFAPMISTASAQVVSKVGKPGEPREVRIAQINSPSVTGVCRDETRKAALQLANLVRSALNTDFKDESNVGMHH